MIKKTVIFGLFLILAFVNWSIFSKEHHLSEGAVVLIKLAPVDPRSLMQGDYMTLRFNLADQIYNELPKNEKYRGWRRNANAEDGFVKVDLDENKLASYDSIHPSIVDSERTVDTLFLRYRVSQGAVVFATNAFFFQEGHAKSFEAAEYGQFRVDEKGELLLEAMVDKDFAIIIPTDEPIKVEEEN